MVYLVEASSFGTLDAILFVLVIVVTASAGVFQGWLEGRAPEVAGGGLAMPRGTGPIVDFLYMITLTCSVPFILGKPSHPDYLSSILIC